MSHALLAPSASSRWLHCAYSIHLQQLLEAQGISLDETPGKRAQLGTLLHEAAAKMALPRTSMMSTTIEYAPKIREFLRPHVAASKLEDLVTACLTLVSLWGNFVRLVKQRMNAAAGGVDPILAVEHCVPIAPPWCYGTADVWLFSREARWLVVADFKTGRRRVDVECNTQIGLYLLGVITLLESLQLLRAGEWRDLRLDGAIFQAPSKEQLRAVPPGETVPVSAYYSIASFSPTWLQSLREQVQDVIQQLRHDACVPKPGQHCRHCPVAHYCPAQESAALSVL